MGDGLAVGAAGDGDGEQVGVDGDGPAAAAALGGGGREAVQGPLPDQVAFHLRGHGGDEEEHLVGDGGAVGAVQAGADASEDVQVDVAGAQVVLEQDEELLHGAGDPVGLVDDQGVPGVQGGQGGAQAGPFTAGARGLDDDVSAVGGGERAELELVVLGAGADPGVAHPHGVGRPGARAGCSAHPHTVPQPVPEGQGERVVGGRLAGRFPGRFGCRRRVSRNRPIAGRAGTAAQSRRGTGRCQPAG